jgi:hypothetical protein
MKEVWNELKPWGVFIEWCGTKFKKFRNFFLDFWSHNGKKRLVFLVQTVEFIFKWSNFNSNRPIINHHITIACRLQRQTVVRAVPSGANTRPGSSAGGTVRPGQAPAPPSNPGAISLMVALARHWNQPYSVRQQFVGSFEKNHPHHCHFDQILKAWTNVCSTSAH